MSMSRLLQIAAEVTDDPGLPEPTMVGVQPESPVGVPIRLHMAGGHPEPVAAWARAHRVRVYIEHDHTHMLVHATWPTDGVLVEAWAWCPYAVLYETLSRGGVVLDPDEPVSVAPEVFLSTVVGA